MDKLDPKTDGASKDITAENIEALKRLFPECVTEGKVDFDVLRELLGGEIDDRPERYSFTWNGKSLARRIAQTPSTGTLRPCPRGVGQLGHDPEHLHRGRQPGGAEAPAEELPRAGEDDLYRSAV